MNTLIIFGSGYLFGAASAAGIAWLYSIAKATGDFADSFGGDTETDTRNQTLVPLVARVKPSSMAAARTISASNGVTAADLCGVLLEHCLDEIAAGNMGLDPVKKGVGQ